MPEPQIWSGTPVAGSHAACHVPPVADTKCAHAGPEPWPHCTRVAIRSGFAAFAAGIAVSVSAAIRGPERGTTAPADADTRSSQPHSQARIPRLDRIPSGR